MPCARLADFGIPATLQHDDLHDANVFVGDGRYRFFDWGDAVVAHPFFSLLVRCGSRRTLASRTGTPRCSAADAYLDLWRSYGTPPELRDQADLALPGRRCSGR